MNAVLHVISDRKRHHLPLCEALVEAAAGGADVIQVREKKAPAAETYDLVLKLQAAFAARCLTADIFVNDRTDIAISADLNGVHLAAKSLPIAAVHKLRAKTGWHGKIGCSVHRVEEAVQAEAAGADYVTFGHIFASASHPGLPPQGLRALERVVEAVSIPVIAIGGISAQNVGDVLATGCSGIAVIGAVLEAEHPQLAARALKRAMEAANPSPKVPFHSPLAGRM
ncbi:thiamine phosphate synthase [Alicyclobacillus cycloheptanicus]|uniref:Thiamine-phosphate synthase n=1 Tax=Alicyclobacillus cycloheptanicus TaxID=1457 RepID=A0ABT9XJ63_9BACL|nr:thiamine phosphate synthase [Alicyclobacillus cycloheptanicus]MDQ0190320.1 thiamine-phosphate pyrophosphorylase [Alicyclobacillus cycloheptanicus]WDM00035.1 thiamine phosphate synthase [Alicyclobacillus cycloheptanicus]